MIKMKQKDKSMKAKNLKRRGKNGKYNKKLDHLMIKMFQN